MKHSYIRANLEISSQVEVTDPAGQPWTVYLLRRGDPHEGMIRGSNLYGLFVTLNVVWRALRRDHRWNVELLKGSRRNDLTTARLIATLPSKADARREAEAVAVAISTGSSVPGR